MDKPATAPAATYLTCDEAAAHLKLSPRTLEKLRTIGGGPRFRKFGRRVMYALQDLDAWSDARACESTSDPQYDEARAVGRYDANGRRPIAAQQHR